MPVEKKKKRHLSIQIKIEEVFLATKGPMKEVATDPPAIVPSDLDQARPE